MASKEILEEIRNRVSIVSLIGERVPLKKSGRNFKGLCPFHQEKTPSFMVSDDKQIFHCFGCSAGGDIFTFLMKIDGLEFREALQDLAKRAGVRLPEETKNSNDADAEWERRKQWSLRLNKMAHDFFIKNLRDKNIGLKSRKYLESRGIDSQTTEGHGLGYAPDSWDLLTNTLAAANVPMKLANELGLVRERDHKTGHYDFFRDRLMFPILDTRGNVVGFSGRTLGTDVDTAKYLNSPDSILYNKSKTAFGLYWAKEAIRTKDEIILVEGNLDCLSLRQSGIENVVAPLGTALTFDHLKLLSRYTKNFVVAFDGDKAGIAAAIRALPHFLELGFVPKALTLPAGQDPDSFIRTEGPAKWETLKNRSETLFEFFVEETLRQSPKGTQGTVAAWEKLRPMLEKVKGTLEKEIYKKQIAQKLKLDEKWLHHKITPTTKKTGEERRFPKEEQLLFTAMLLKPKLIDRIQGFGEVFTDPELKEYGKQLFETPAEERVSSLAGLQSRLPESLAKWIREMALVEEEDALWEKAVEDCLSKMSAKNLGVRLNELNAEIAQAESEQNEATLLNLLQEKTKLMESKKRSLP